MQKFSQALYTGAPLFSHQDAVITLSFSLTGAYLVSGGYDGANVWEVGTGRKMAVPFRTNSVPAISASAWLRFEDLDTDVLVLGTACAHLFFYSIKKGSSKVEPLGYKKVLMSDTEILSIAARQVSSVWRIALGTMNGYIQVWTIDQACDLVRAFSQQIANLIPRAVFFDSRTRTLIIFGLQDGRIEQLNELDGTRHTPGRNVQGIKVMGYVAYDEQKNVFAFDDCDHGFNLMTMSDFNKISHMVGGECEIYLPKQVVFGEDGDIIVAGSEDGKALIFDPASGKRLQKLHHYDHLLVQTVAATTTRSHAFIATASSDMGVPNPIMLWKKPRGHFQFPDGSTDQDLPRPLLSVSQSASQAQLGGKRDRDLPQGSSNSARSGSSKGHEQHLPRPLPPLSQSGSQTPNSRALLLPSRSLIHQQSFGNSHSTQVAKKNLPITAGSGCNTPTAADSADLALEEPTTDQNGHPVFLYVVFLAVMLYYASVSHEPNSLIGKLLHMTSIESGQVTTERMAPTYPTTAVEHPSPVTVDNVVITRLPDESNEGNDDPAGDEMDHVWLRDAIQHLIMSKEFNKDTMASVSAEAARRGRRQGTESKLSTQEVTLYESGTL